MKILEMPKKIPAQEATTYCCVCRVKLLIEESDIFHKDAKEEYWWMGRFGGSKIPYFKCMHCGVVQDAKRLKWQIKKEETDLEKNGETL